MIWRKVLGDLTAQKLRDQENVDRVEGRIVGTARWNVPGDRRENLALQGVVDFTSKDTLDQVRLTSGALPKAGEILFEKGARDKYNLRLDQEVTLYGPDTEKTYKIVGFGDNPNVISARASGFATAWL